MIEFIFTIDYEIYGNGEGSLSELVYEPARRLKEIFRERNVRFVPFVEVAELEMIERKKSDPAIHSVKQQIRDFHCEGFELGLHLHPQWYNAQYENGKWVLDYAEYDLCRLPRERIVQIVDRSLAYLRGVLGNPEFVPFSFRAGNWLLQPAKIAADVLAKRGIRVDSSVFKGGLQHRHGLDYRRALRNGHYWTFKNHVDIPDRNGSILEVPIHTEMVLPWRMVNSKRVGLERKASSIKDKLCRFFDFVRLRQPLKLDFCRMTLRELTSMLDTAIAEDKRGGAGYRPIVAIGHTKDLVDFGTIEALLAYLEKRQVRVTTFSEAYSRCIGR
jgi:hypothetical protein